MDQIVFKSWAMGNSSVGNRLALRTQGSEFDAQNPHIKAQDGGTHL